MYMKHGQKVLNGFDAQVYYYVGDSVRNNQRAIIEAVEGGAITSAKKEHLSPHFEFGDNVFHKQRVSVFLKFGKEKGMACIVGKGDTDFIVVSVNDLETREGF